MEKDYPNKTIVNETYFNDTEDGTFDVNFTNSITEKTGFYIIGGIGLLGNAFVLLVMFKSVILRGKISYMLIINQSIIDMLTSLFMIVNKIIDGMDWPWVTQPGVRVTIFCRVWLSEYIPWSCMVVSTFNLIAITIERYIAVVFPFFYKHHILRKYIWVVIAVVWILGFIESIHFVTSSTMDGYSCSLWTAWPSVAAETAVGITNYFFIEYLIPICMMIFCYGRIIFTIHKQAKRNVGSSRREEQLLRSRILLTRTLICVALGYFLCHSWSCIYAALFYMGIVDTFEGLQFQIGAFASVCNCCINPFIYAFSHTLFRDAMMQIFTNGKGGTASDTKRSITATQKTNSDDNTARSSNQSSTMSLTTISFKVDNSGIQFEQERRDSPCEIKAQNAISADYM